MTPRSDSWTVPEPQSEPWTLPTSQSLETELRAENNALRARISELEAREEAEATKIWQQAQRIAELETEIKKLTIRDESATLTLVRCEMHIAELEEAILDARDLLRTGVAPDAFNMTPDEWNTHKINKAAGELTRALEPKP